MATTITVPRLGWNMDEGVFMGWLKEDGQAVRPGDPLFILEGEKATQDIEASDAGILRIPSTAPSPGDTVAVGLVIGYLLGPGETEPVGVSPAVENGAGSSSGGHVVSIAPEAVVLTASGTPADRGNRPRISPLARRLARELGVQLVTAPRQWLDRADPQGRHPRSRRGSRRSGVARIDAGRPGDATGPVGTDRADAPDDRCSDDREPSHDRARDAEHHSGRDESGEPPGPVQGGLTAGTRAARLYGLPRQADCVGARRPPDASGSLGRGSPRDPRRAADRDRRRY